MSIRLTKKQKVYATLLVSHPPFAETLYNGWLCVSAFFHTEWNGAFICRTGNAPAARLTASARLMGLIVRMYYGKVKKYPRILEQAVHTFLHFIFEDRLSGVLTIIPEKPYQVI